MADTNIGRFVWYDLMTTDTKAAIAFYTDVVGWKSQQWENGPYTMLVSGQGPVGGVMAMPEEAKKMGAPAAWMGYVGVADLDKNVAEARKLGGRILKEPTEIPKVGRFAVIADPQGATIQSFQPLPSSQGMSPHETTKPGEFCWSELLTTDHEGAFRFYSQLYGWEKINDFDMGAMGPYRIYGKGGKQFGGMMTKPKEMKMPPAWGYYAQVADLDAAVARAKAKGAKLLNGPMEVPGGARIAQLMDPQGVSFNLHVEPKKS
jgi:predicted enzyme related to lactoylglutathione lyase